MANWLQGRSGFESYGHQSVYLILPLQLLLSVNFKRTEEEKWPLASFPDAGLNKHWIGINTYAVKISEN